MPTGLGAAFVALPEPPLICPADLHPHLPLEGLQPESREPAPWWQDLPCPSQLLSIPHLATRPLALLRFTA